MKRKVSIEQKAAFLVIVFSLNTLVGFACAIGMDMGFNSDEKKHNHHDEATNHHDERDNDHDKSKDSKDNCCNDKVIQFAHFDKSLSPSLNFLFSPAFFTAFVSTFYNIDVLLFSQGSPNIKYFVRSHHPPIPDIRIAIQSFQI